MARKAIGKLAKKIPGAKQYLSEKQAMHEQLDAAQATAGKLEKRNTQLEKRIERLKDHVVPHVRFITNQLNATGAPLIFMDVVKDFIKQHPETMIDFHTFLPVDNQYIDEFQKLGVAPVVHQDWNSALDFIDGDVVVLNTAAHSPALKNSIYEALEAGIVKRLIWYIQEDWPEIFFDETEKQRITGYLNSGKIVIFSPAEKARSNIQNFFKQRENVKKQTYRIKIPKQYHQVRKPQDFNKLIFTMVGRTGEGIKGHLPILYAFLSFQKLFLKNNPASYRDFELRFIAIENDYLSRQILTHGHELGVHFRTYSPLPRDEALKVIKSSNVTICYSMRECLPIFVFEGMIAGHPILRNKVSGLEEQLVDGENGMLLSSKSYSQVLDTIEKILNKQSTSNKTLAAMSEKSYDIAKQFENNSYEPLIKNVWQSFNSD